LPLAVEVSGGGDVGRDDGDTQSQGQSQPFGIAKFILRMGEGALLAGVGEQWQLVPFEMLVEGDQSLVGRIDAHNARDPFYQNCALGCTGIHACQGVLPIRVDGGAEEQLRVPGDFAGQELIRDVDLCRS